MSSALFSTQKTNGSSPPIVMPLLLEGDGFEMSHEGIARTLYELRSSSHPTVHAASPVAIEEVYDLPKAHKTYIVRQQVRPSNNNNNRDASHHQQQQLLGSRAQGVASLGPELAKVRIQEIDRGVFNAAGTGGMTWESSIAMGLYFAANPVLLQGDVIELGSGVGLGGMLAQVGSELSTQRGVASLHSITLTDGNDEVLQQCRQNVQLAGTDHKVHVTKLDWNDFVRCRPKHQCNMYDTVIASDCAYRYQDIPALGETMHGLLSERNKAAAIHFFGPHNRNALYDILKYLDEQLDLDVKVEPIELQRYRLRPGHRRQDRFDICDCLYSSRQTAFFLHLTAKQKSAVELEKEQRDDTSIYDLD